MQTNDVIAYLDWNMSCLFLEFLLTQEHPVRWAEWLQWLDHPAAQIFLAFSGLGVVIYVGAIRGARRRLPFRRLDSSLDANEERSGDEANTP